MFKETQLTYTYHQYAITYMVLNFCWDVTEQNHSQIKPWIKTLQNGIHTFESSHSFNGY